MSVRIVLAFGGAVMAGRVCRPQRRAAAPHQKRREEVGQTADYTDLTDFLEQHSGNQGDSEP